MYDVGLSEKIYCPESWEVDFSWTVWDAEKHAGKMLIITATQWAEFFEYIYITS